VHRLATDNGKLTAYLERGENGPALAPSATTSRGQHVWCGFVGRVGVWAAS
jgi:hypothetical protein